MRIAVSKKPKRVGFPLPSPEDGNRPSFQNVVFYLFAIPNNG
jgi:hypothetical protein